MKFSETTKNKQQTETVVEISASMRSCKNCVHNQVCEARRTLYRSFKQFDKEFGDMVDIGVIHNEDSSCVDLLAKSCKYYLPRPDRVVIEELKQMAVSNWVLYIGVFLCATGVGVVIGAIFIFCWGIQKLEEAKQGNSYTENNFTANIDHYHAGDDGSDIDDWRKSATPIHGAVSEDVPKDYLSKDTQEENR